MRMPAAFLGHGSPMNALDDNRFTRAWAAFGRSVPRPRGILAVSAHWYTTATAVTAMSRPPTIHDFFGFPQRLFEVDYPAPGSPEIAEEVADVVSPTWVGQDVDAWGIDHGTWSVLVHAFPDASVPVVQLSLNAFEDADYHLELGRRLAPLRDSGILVVASGNIVHNLREIDFSRPDGGDDWAVRFDDAVHEVLAEDPSGVAALDGHADYAHAVPTPDHYIPLLYLAGLADGERLDPLVRGYAAGSLSMSSYVLGTPVAPAGGDSVAGSAAAPLPGGVPPEATNA